MEATATRPWAADQMETECILCKKLNSICPALLRWSLCASEEPRDASAFCVVPAWKRCLSVGCFWKPCVLSGSAAPGLRQVKKVEGFAGAAPGEQSCSTSTTCLVPGTFSGQCPLCKSKSLHFSVWPGLADQDSARRVLAR